MDLSQSSAVYGLYAAAAAGASALHHPNNSAAIFNPFLQNPTVFSKSVGELGREDTATGDRNTNSHRTQTPLSLNGTEHGSAVYGANERTKIENGRSTINFPRASVVVETRVPAESNASLLPKSNGVRIGKADYLGERGHTVNGNQQVCLKCWSICHSSLFDETRTTNRKMILLIKNKEAWSQRIISLNIENK